MGPTTNDAPGAARSPYARGRSTSYPSNVDYRIGKLAALGITTGDWLDVGCADGGYLRPLLAAGASTVTGVDVEEETLTRARADLGGEPRIRLRLIPEDRLPLDSSQFAGCLLNEVLEHCLSDTAMLAEVRRVLVPGGHVAVFSPNRYFPFEGHGIRLGSHRYWGPVPLAHWLPQSVRERVLFARTYTPRGLVSLVSESGFEVVSAQPVLPCLERWNPLPSFALPAYRRAVPRAEATPLVRTFLAVSSLVVARRPLGG